MAVCRLLAGWHSLEKNLGGGSIIDFNLPGFVDPDSGKRYSARSNVLDDLKALQDDPEIKAYPRLLQKLRAQEVYLRNVMGEHWDFVPYIESILGFLPAYISEDDLAAQREKIEAPLRPWNIRVDKDLSENFASIQKTIEKERVIGFFHELFGRNAELLSSMIGSLPGFDFRIEFHDVDAYWQNWVDGSGKDYLLRFNARVFSRYEIGHCVKLAFHEVLVHMVQAALVCEKIESGDMPRCMGLTTVHEPEQFQSEGLAQTLTYFLDSEDSRSPLLVAANEIDLYRRMVMQNNAHIMINSGRSIEDCTDYIVTRMPYENPRDVAHSLCAKVNNPQFRAYEHVYAASALFFREVATNTDAEQKRTFLKRVYHEWLSPRELAEFRLKL